MRKKKPINWSFLKYFFWLGPALIVMGLSSGFISGVWFPEAISFLLSGSVITGLGLLFQSYFRQKNALANPYWQRRSTQAGTNAVAATLSVLAILGFINFLAVRHPVELDLTENQQFTLAPQTQTLIQSLPQPVKVWIFDQNQNPQTKELLDKYRRLSPSNFSYEFVDPQTSPGLAEEFEIQDFGEIYLESGEKRQSIRKEGIEPLDEIRLTNAVEQLFSGRTPKIYFLQGHGERPLTDEQGGLAEAVEVLEEKSFITEELNLASSGGAPGDADVIVVASPQRKLFEGEVEALENFLNQGKGILLMLDPKTNHGLEDLLDDWGVKLDDRLAIDATGRGNLVGLGPTEPIVQEYGDHPITQDFGNGISVYPYARSVETRPISGVTENPLIWTDGQSWAESDLTGEELVFDPERDRQGPLSLGVALTREAQLLSNDSSSEVTTETPETNQADTEGVTNNAEAGSETSELVSTEEAEQLEADLEADVEPDVEPDIEPESPSSNVAEETEPESQEAETNSENAETDPEDSVENSAANSEAEARLVVIGNSQFATNGWFDQQLNGDVFLNTVNWLSQPDQETFSIRPKPVTNRRIVLTPALGRALGWTALVIWPLLGFAMAGFLWWRRMA